MKPSSPSSVLATASCLVVHLGADEWMIVDSCVSPDHHVPALNYLDRIGVETATAVKLVVATHWHDDHVRGISQIVDRCPGAQVVWSVALQSDELIRGVGSRRPFGRFDSVKTTSGVEEMRRIFAQVGERRIVWAVEGRCRYQRGGTSHCHIRALSPSDRVVTRAQSSIRDLLFADPAIVVGRPDRNLTAVVLWVEVGERTMLLGADLQQSPPAHSGWSTIVGANARPRGSAEVFKVPHHGSANGHHEPVWAEMLVPKPEAVVCPCANGSTKLPTEDDIERLCNRSRAHVTAQARPDLVRHNGRRRRPVIAEFGRVTLRRPLDAGATWDVAYVSPAHCPCT